MAGLYIFFVIMIFLAIIAYFLSGESGYVKEFKDIKEEISNLKHNYILKELRIDIIFTPYTDVERLVKKANEALDEADVALKYIALQRGRLNMLTKEQADIERAYYRKEADFFVDRKDSIYRRFIKPFSIEVNEDDCRESHCKRIETKVLER